jgi:quercetin dioxygenase-like cupin family protein
MNGEETRYKAGDWYHVPAQAIHAARFDETTSEIKFWFHSKK